MSDIKTNNENNLKVNEHPDYKIITEEYLQKLKFDSYHSKNNKSYKYFSKALQFYVSVKDRSVSSLTENQQNWLWEISVTIHDRINSGQLTLPMEHKPESVIPEPVKSSPETFVSRFKSFIKTLLFWQK